jgi:hypothetical protein
VERLNPRMAHTFKGYEMKVQRISALLLGMVLASLAGCMTTGYSTAKDPDMVRRFDVTIVEIEPQNIYNATAVFWLGPFASVEHKGQKITFIDAIGEKQTIVQPMSSLYELKAGQPAVYVVDRGEVWVQPTDYPLPAEFNTAPPK